MPSLYPNQSEKTVVDFASDYLKRGWQLVSIPTRSKNPGDFGWKNLPTNENDLQYVFSKDRQNIGVLLGEKSNGLTDVDLDTKEAVSLADHFLPKTNAVFGRKSNHRSHRLYISDFSKMEKFQFDGKTIVEIRTADDEKQLQTVFPPSIHESGENITWHKNGEPLRINSTDLRRAVSLLASACLISKFWKDGIRHELSLAVSGALLRNGYDEQETENFIKAICFSVNDEETQDRLKSVATTAEKIKTGGNYFGIPKLVDLTEKKLADTLSKWLGLANSSAYIGGASNKSANRTQNNFSANPKPLDLTLKTVEEIDTDFLPQVLTDWLQPASKIIGCPFDFLVLSAIVTAGSLVGSRVRVKPLENSDWFVVPNLYAGLVGLPSTKKTPALDETRKPILELQAEAQKEYKIAKSDYEIEAKFYDRQENDLFKKNKNLASLKLQLEGLPKPQEPKLKRFETNDVTASKLIQLLSDNPNGFMLFRDELSGWLRSLDAEYDKSARAFFLELWKGAITYELARVDGREIQLTSGTLSIIGGIQPSKLQRYVSEAYSFDNSDGFLQRLVFSYPDKQRQTEKPTASDYGKMREGFNEANKTFRKLAEYDFHGKYIAHNDDVFHAVKFSLDAQKFIDQWKDEIEAEAESFETEDEPFSSFLSKMPKNCFAIALIFHCLETINLTKFPNEISETTALKAIAYSVVLISHAKRVFALGENQVFALAKVFIGKIKNGKLNQGFTQRDVKRKGWSGLKNDDDIKDVLGLLIDYGYLKEDSQKSTGRPTARYIFHSSLEPKAKDEN